jgi:hypothetical protein
VPLTQPARIGRKYTRYTITPALAATIARRAATHDVDPMIHAAAAETAIRTNGTSVRLWDSKAARAHATTSASIHHRVLRIQIRLQVSASQSSASE